MNRFPFRPANHWEAGFRAGFGIAAMVFAGVGCLAMAIVR